MIVCIVHLCACGHEEITVLELDSSAPGIRLDLVGLPVTLSLDALSSVASRLRNLASSVMPERGSPDTDKGKILAGDAPCELRINVLPAGDGEAA